MKTSLATTLSIVGVLATGGAALAANTTVLDLIVPSVQGSPPLAEAIVPVIDLSVGSTATGGAVAVVDTTVLDSTVSSVPTETTAPFGDLSVSSTTSIVVSVTPVTTVAPAPGTSVAPTSVQFAYNIAGVGTITLKQDATSLKVVSVNPVSGWTFKAENKHATRVEVEFENGKRSVEFRAELLDGRVIAAVKVDEDTDEDNDNDDAKAAYDAATKAAKAAYDAAEDDD